MKSHFLLGLAALGSACVIFVAVLGVLLDAVTGHAAGVDDWRFWVVLCCGFGWAVLAALQGFALMAGFDLP